PVAEKFEALIAAPGGFFVPAAAPGRQRARMGQRLVEQPRSSEVVADGADEVVLRPDRGTGGADRPGANRCRETAGHSGPRTAIARIPTIEPSRPSRRR